MFSKKKESKILENFNDELTSLIKTELISPLEVIRTSTEFLLRGISGPLLPEQKDFVNRISSQSQKALSLVHDLIDISRMDTGFELNFVNLSIRDILDSTIKLCEKKLKGKKIDIKLDSTLPNFSFLGDIARIEQVFKNVLDLCIVEGNDGSSIFINGELIQGQRKSDVQRNYYKIRFSYKGLPLSEEEQKSIFDHSLAKIDRPQFLSLPALRQIIVLHKGGLTYEKTSETQAELSIILPSIEKAPKEHPFASIDALLIGSDKVALAALAENLKEINIFGTIESDLEKALDKLKEKLIHLIVLDYNPSDTMLSSFIDRFNKEKSEGKNIPLIISLKPEYQKGLVHLERYFTDTISKPFDKPEIIMKLSSYFPGLDFKALNATQFKPKVLVVEDNIEIRKQFKEILSSKYSVTICKNGMEALFFVKKENYLCAIFDAEMPIMDGIELVIKLRQFNKMLPVIFSSSANIDLYRRGASLFGVSHVLQKPFQSKDLLQIIEEIESSLDE